MYRYQSGSDRAVQTCCQPVPQVALLGMMSRASHPQSRPQSVMLQARLLRQPMMLLQREQGRNQVPAHRSTSLPACLTRQCQRRLSKIEDDILELDGQTCRREECLGENNHVAEGGCHSDRVHGRGRTLGRSSGLFRGQVAEGDDPHVNESSVHAPTDRHVDA